MPELVTVQYPDVITGPAYVTYSLGEHPEVTFGPGEEGARRLRLVAPPHDPALPPANILHAYEQSSTPISTTSTKPTLSTVTPMRAKTSWTRFIPQAFYLVAAGVAILTVWSRTPSFALLIPLLVVIGILVQRRQYSERIQGLASALISEAQVVRSLYPKEYPAYFEETKYELARLGLDDLVADLPKK
jgi:hypothetical protein